MLIKLILHLKKWDNEAERLKILSEKHARGSVARSNRETRVQEKEMRKMRREFRYMRILVIPGGRFLE